MSSVMLCFVDKTEYEFSGNVCNQCILTADVDNDKLMELCLANIEGELAIFKHSSAQPWSKFESLGTVTCMGFGNLCHSSKEGGQLICLTAEGWCHMFRLSSNHQPVVDGAGSSGIHQREHLPPNSKALLVGDIDGDGRCELAVAFSDRAVVSFRWVQPDADETDGYFQKLNKWQLAGQVGSLVIGHSADSFNLIVAQPGGTYVKLNTANATDPRELTYVPLSSSRTRNPTVSTEMVRCRYKDDENDTYALITLDGDMKLVQDEQILWSIHVDHQLFGLTSCDVTGDGFEEMVVCSWGGQTYIINRRKQMLRFNFQQHVAAFCAGLYSVDGDSNKSCLIYVCVGGRIVVFHDLPTRNMVTKNLLHELRERTAFREYCTNNQLDADDDDTVRGIIAQNLPLKES